MPKSSSRRDLEERIRESAAKLRAENHVDPADKAGIDHRRITCLVLAAHRELSGNSTELGALHSALEKAITEPGGWIIRGFTRAMLYFSKNPMTTLVRYTRKNVPPRYGPTFSFNEEGNDARSFTLRVTKCYYNEFFTRNGAPELTKLFCGWDKHWIEPNSPKVHGVQFERPTTLAAGDDSCAFTFNRVDDEGKNTES